MEICRQNRLVKSMLSFLRSVRKWIPLDTHDGQFWNFSILIFMAFVFYW